MYDFSTLISKVDALKAKIEQSSITPLYLGSLLNDFLLAMHGVDMTDMPASASAALEKATNALEQASAAMTAAESAGGKADAATTQADNNTKLIKQLQGNLQTVDWILKSISAGSAAPDSVKAKMRRVNAWSSEEDEREIVLLHGATEEAAGAMTAQQVKALKLAKGFMATKGRAEGIAPLDADKHVPDENIAPKFFDVLMFDSVVDEEVTVTNISSSTLGYGDEGAAIVYSSKLDRFLLKITQAGVLKPTYCNNFRDSERYGTLGIDGVCPVEGKIYIEGERGYPYVWYDLMLFHIDNYAEDLVDALKSTKGRAEGLAPLDSSALVPEKHLPDKVFDVLTFIGIDDSLYDLEAGSAAATPEDANASLVYSSVRDRFVLRVRETVSGGGISTNPPKYYGWFNGAERYGTADHDGIVPYENKLYLDLYDGGVYYWYDLMLRKTDLDVSIRVDSLENKIGKANGIAPLNASGVVPNENISDEARKSLFCDLFNAAAGTAGYAKFTNGVWDCKLNGLTLTYDEAVLIYNVTNGSPATRGFSNARIRTNLWNDLLGYAGGPANDICPAMLFKNCFSIEVIRFNAWVHDPRGMFSNCYKLTKVIGGFIGDYGWPKNRMTELFPNSPLITSFQLERLQNDVSFANNPLIDLDSFTYMVEHRATHITDAYTITVHADVYAKLTGDTTNEAAAALTAEELAQWQALLTKAAGKHIAFASA